MTAQEAFAIAFDEAPDISRVAEDKKPPQNVGKNPLGGTGDDLGGLLGSLDKDKPSDKSISAHMQQYHPNGFNPKTDKCKYYDAMKKNLQQQGLSEEEAEVKATAMHNGASFGAEPPKESSPVTEEEGKQLSSQMLREFSKSTGIEQLNAISAQSRKFDKPVQVQMADGTVKEAQDTFQMMCWMKLNEDMDNGITQAEKTAVQIENQVEKNKTEEEGGQKIGEQNQAHQTPTSAKTMTNKGGEPVELDQMQSAIIAENPAKKITFLKMIDADYDLKHASSDAERAEFARQREALSIMFYGNDSGGTVGGDSGEPPNEPTTPTPPMPPEGGDGSGTPPPTNPPNPPISEGSGDGTVPPNKPPVTQPNESKPPEDEKQVPEQAPVQRPSTPSDEEFQVAPGKYKVGGMVYTDVSGQGLFRGMLSAFFAGLRGEGIITGWDRITGTWDGMKRSEKGEMVRDGIAGSLLSNALNEYSGKDGLSDDAKMELEAVKEMMNSAKTANQKMSAVKAFQKWKEKYEDELGETTKATGDFSGIAQKSPGWKAPPTSILPEVPADERDTAFMDKMHDRIVENLKKKGIGATILKKINGSSVVQFKIQREHAGTDKALKDALNAMQADIGAQISYSPDLTSGEERMGTITINNPKVKDASLRRLLEDKEGVEAAKKMAAPLLIGETPDGKAVWVDASEHGFLGGDSGGGKSERILGMVAGAYSVKPPSEFQVVFNAHANSADFEDYEDDPHTGGIGKTVEEVAQNLANANAEWKRRQKLFASMGIRNLKEYNKAMEEAGTPEKKLPQILVITDEVTDLLLQRPDLAKQIRAIVTNGRKFGVAHLGATQDMQATNMPTDIKGSLRMGVKTTKKEAPRAIFDMHTDELGKISGKGDIMYRNKSGNLVRLRGTFASPEARAKLRDYNSGKITVPPDETPKPEAKPQEGSGTKPQKPDEIPPLKKGFTSKKSESGKLKFFDADGKLVGWSIHGKNYKATLSPDGKMYIGTLFKEGEKLPWAQEDSEDKPSDGEPEKPAKPKNWRLAKSRKDAIDSLTAAYKKKQADAEEALEKSKGTDVDTDKWDKAMDDADEWFQNEMSRLDRRWPDTGNGDELGGGDSSGDDTSPSDTAPTEENKDTWESPYAVSKKKESRIEEARKEYDEAYKALQKAKGLTKAQKELILAHLEDKYNKHVEQINEGKSETQIAKEKASADKELRDKVEAASSVSLNSLSYSKKSPVFGSKELSERKGVTKMPKKLVDTVKSTLMLPEWEGFQIDSDAKGNPIWVEGQYGLVRNPDTGVFGKIRKNGTIIKLIDPTNEKFKGPNSKEAEAANKTWKKALNKHGEGSPEEKAADRERNLIKFGVPVIDEGLDNKTIVANAIVNAMLRLERPTEG